MGKLEGEVAIVTGGAMGLGAGIVDKFIKEGASIVILDFNIAPLKDKPEHPKIKVVQGDVAEPDSWQRALKIALDSFGKVTIVVNNAGVIAKNTPTHLADISELDRLLRVNLKGVIVSVQQIVPYMEKEKINGAFINVTSMSAMRPRVGTTFYGASKAAADNANKCLALEYAPLNIRFCGVAPVIANTPMKETAFTEKVSDETLASSIPLGRIAQPEDIANMCAQLASSESSMITGITVPVDGGRSV